MRAKRASKDDGPGAAGSISAVGAFVYILKCSDNSFYVGSATGDDLSKRVAEHQVGRYAGYTSKRRPVELVWSEHFEQVTDALAAERKIKGWSHAKKEALIFGNWDRVKWLAKRPGARGKNPI